MKNNFLNILLTIFVFSFIIWLGGTVLRTMISYNLFQFGITMELKPTYTNIERMNTIYLFSTTSLLTGISYGLSVIAGIVIAFLWRNNFKQWGWLFMSLVLFILIIPLQSYFIYLDYRLADAIYYRNILDFYHPDIQKYFVERYKDITNASLYSLMLLASFTLVLYLIWKPLNKDKKIF